MPTARGRQSLERVMGIKTFRPDELALKWEREAYDRNRMAERPGYSDLERRMLRTQAVIYTACARDLREAGARG